MKAKILKTMCSVFLTGMALGGLMAISIRYPVKPDAVKSAEAFCKDHLGYAKFKVGITGKVYKIECNNRKIFEMK